MSNSSIVQSQYLANGGVGELRGLGEKYLVQ